MDDLQRLWAKVDRDAPDGHWLWTAARDPGGYAIGVVGGRARRVHRFLYELLVGPIPDGLQLDHLCRVRHCVNPAHLEPVTGAENLRRSPLTNGNKTHCKHGHPYDAANTRYRGRRRECLACEKSRRVRNA